MRIVAGPYIKYAYAMTAKRRVAINLVAVGYAMALKCAQTSVGCLQSSAWNCLFGNCQCQ